MLESAFLMGEPMVFGRIGRVGGLRVFGTLEEDVIYYATFGCKKASVR